MSPVVSAMCAWLLSQPAPPIEPPIKWGVSTWDTSVPLASTYTKPARVVCPVHGPLRIGWGRLDVVRFISHDGCASREVCFRCVVAAIERPGCVPVLEELDR